MRKILYTTFASAVALQTLAVSAIDPDGTYQTTSGDNGTGGDFIGTLDNILGYLIGLLYFVAVIFALWGGFQILTAGGDEEKVKKGKTTLIQAVIGLVVIFLASNIIRWVIGLGTGGSIVS